MDKLTQAWISLGIAFAGRGLEAADPERTLIESLNRFQEERKILRLILAWIKDFGDLLHVERLKALSKNLTPFELAWLGGLASYATGWDRRWYGLEKEVSKRLGEPKPIFKTTKLDELVAKRQGTETNFKKFGLVIPIIKPGLPKKLLKRSSVVKDHPWLRLRSLFGTNWRADIAWQLLQFPNKTPYRVAKDLGCTTETAYRNWQALKEANAEQILRVA